MKLRRDSRRTWLALLLAGGMALLAACRGALGGINVVQEAGLTATTAIEVNEQPHKPDLARLREGVITDPATIAQLVAALDRHLPLGPLMECVPQFRLRFRLADGRIEEFDYYCEGGASFLRGSQPFWRQQEIRPPAEFDAAMQRAFEALH